MLFLFKEDATRTTHYNKNEEFIAVAYNTLEVFLEFLGASPAAAWASYYFFFSLDFYFLLRNFIVFFCVFFCTRVYANIDEHKKKHTFLH